MIHALLNRFRNRICRVDPEWEMHDEQAERARRHLQRVQERLDMVRQAKFEAHVLSQTREGDDVRDHR